MTPRAAGEAPGAAVSHLRVTQVRSGIGTKPKHRATLRALGLRGVGRSRVLADGASLRGMLARVTHLVEVEPAEAGDVVARQRRSDARRARHAAPDEEGAPGPARARTRARTRPAQK